MCSFPLICLFQSNLFPVEKCVAYTLHCHEFFFESLIVHTYQSTISVGNTSESSLGKYWVVYTIN